MLSTSTRTYPVAFSGKVISKVLLFTLTSIGVVSGTTGSVSAIVINTPFAVCFDRNSKREGLTRVPDNQMYRMRNLYKVPTYNEPFDNIFVVENGVLMGRVKGQRRK